MGFLSQFGIAGAGDLLVAAIDILIVAWVFYRLLLLIRRTRAVRMAVGLGLLFLFSWIARRFGLVTIDYLLSNVFTIIAIAIVVLFAPEIRRALASLGRTPFFRTRRTRQDPIDDIVTAATALASKRHGAIMVLEREMALRNYTERGIALDAAISYDLLVSIFNPESPLHDGAVVILDDRMVAASCFLPLTLNPRLSRELGSRHRAAIGISEESDAVAVVVSEETGTISVVVDGRMLRRLDAATLGRRLRELLLVEEKVDETSEVAGGADKKISGAEAPEGIGK